MKSYYVLLCFLGLYTAIPIEALSQFSNAPASERLQLAADIEYSLTNELLKQWYPRCVDSTYGGFLSAFTYNFTPAPNQDKFIVTQARHTWTAAKAAELYPQTGFYLQCARHGFNFLKHTMWDSVYGGFYNLVDRQGRVKASAKTYKDAYGNAFAIYALAAYYHASKDVEALELAKKAFKWLEKHSHDSKHLGYFQHLDRDGSSMVRKPAEPSTSDLGYKDQNSSIHLLEALTELYKVWPDALVKKRLEEMLHLVRDVITNHHGSLTLFFHPDWTPVSFSDSSEAIILQHKQLDHVSFGHDIETAYLMLEASHALGLKDDQRTLQASKKMTDHTLTHGWDNAVGGIFDEGYYYKDRPGVTIILNTKNWWAQAEALNTLLLMADLHPGDPQNYFEKFKKQWKYINTYLVDHENGGWYDAGLDKSPGRKLASKGHIWKGAYHDFRSLANCVSRLRNGL